MGIYKLGEQFLKTIVGPGELQKLDRLKKINHFFLDVNGILHAIAQLTFAYRTSEFGYKQAKEKAEYLERVKLIDGKNWKDLMIEYEMNLFKELDHLMRLVKPNKTICLCVDGVAPAAKISQQRMRRFIGSTGKLNIPKADTGFSSTYITPGTEFMIIVDGLLEKWVRNNKNKFPKIKYIYSSHLIEGEGEHKIFEIIDRYNIGNYNDTYAIEGLDSDLVSLTVLRPQSFFLVRKERKDFIDIDGFKQFILNNMNINYFAPDLVIKDFVLILYLVGNDFLPRFLFVDNVGLTLKLMMECYTKFVKIPLTTYNNMIQWTSLSSFFSCLTGVEIEMLMDKSLTEFAYEHPILHSDKAKSLASEGKGDKYINYVSKGWYDYILLPSTELGKQLTEQCKIKNEINKLCKELCKGLLWVLRYYTRSSRSKNYIFKYQNCPLIADLWKYIMVSVDTQDFQEVDDIIDAESEDGFNYISQLMAVTPEKYNSIIPKPFNKEMLVGGKFNYLNPKKFPIKREGLKELKDFFMEKAMLPIVPSKEIIDYVNVNKFMWSEESLKMIEEKEELTL